MKSEGKDLDVITFAGNGEPTLHPEFQIIIDFTIESRNAYFPKVRIANLSTGSLLHKPEIRKALSMADEAILKLDSANQESNLLLNHPRYPNREPKACNTFGLPEEISLNPQSVFYC